MENNKKVFNRQLAVLLAFTTLVLFFNVWGWGVTETSEARYAEISWEMYSSGDYLHPTLLQIGHYHKPPVTYWITTFAYYIFGPNVFAARFFLQVAVLIQLILIYKMGCLLFRNRKTAILAAWIYISFPAVIISTRALTTDAYLTTFILAALYFWMKYRIRGALHGLYACYILLGLGFLTKGPVVFIIPLIVIIVFNKIFPAPKVPRSGHHLTGALVMTCISLSWFVILYLENPEFLHYFLIDHLVNRVATNNFHRAQPFWFYLLIAPLISFPWFFIFIRRGFTAWKNHVPLTGLLLAWVAIPLLLFSLPSSKLVLYILPIFPGLALGAAYLWKENNPATGWLRTTIIFSLMATGGLAVYSYMDTGIHTTLPMYILMAVTAGGLLLIYAYWHKRANLKAVIASSVFFCGMFTILSTYFLAANPGKVHDQKNVAAFIRSLPSPEVIYVYNERLPSLAFHLRRPLISIQDGDRGLDREIQFEKDSTWKETLIPMRQAMDPLANSVLVAPAKVQESDSLRMLIGRYDHKQIIDGWQVCFKER